MKVSILDDYMDTVGTLDVFTKLDAHDVTVWTDHVQDVDVLAERLVDTEAPPGVTRAHRSLGEVSDAQIRRHASVRTSCNVSTMKSISVWPQMSGGESWMTGSPRSSARQISPASNSAPDR